MASPILRGTFSSSAFSSRDIDIIKEKIHFSIDKDFNTGNYVIEYFIKTDLEGKQTPLLFYARDYTSDFKLWVDDQEVKLLEIPHEYISTINTPFERFANSFKKPFREGESETVEISWEKNSAFVYELNDLKYFEADLTAGEHIIRIEYAANVWTDITGWVKEYSFRYSLSPAQYWRSFGSLEIVLDATASNYLLETNLGQPTHGKLDSIAFWNFNKLPVDFIKITYKPQVSSLAKAMIAIGPIGLTLIIAILITLFHLIQIKRYRKNNPSKKHSWVVIVGSIVIPSLIIISYMLSFGIIDRAIGKEAGNYHGYTFLIIMLSPILWPIYWLIMLRADNAIKRKMNKAQKL